MKEKFIKISERCDKDGLKKLLKLDDYNFILYHKSNLK